MLVTSTVKQYVLEYLLITAVSQLENINLNGIDPMTWVHKALNRMGAFLLWQQCSLSRCGAENLSMQDKDIDELKRIL